MVDFSKAPEEVRRYFDAKGTKPSWSWKDFSQDEHATAHTVAKSTGFDILTDVRTAMSKAIAERVDYADFAKELEPLLKAKGWWGKVEAVDPLTGKKDLVQLGSPRRLATIYWANVNTAYAAGEWERIWDNREFLPYLEYLHTTSIEPRAEHLTWVGTILLVEDTWWATHYPPNGWQCKCRVRQLGGAEAKRLGYNADKPKRPVNFGSKTFTNSRTGEVTTVPKGIDPGWANNPGLTRTKNAADMLAGKIAQMSAEAQRAATTDLANSWLMKRIVAGEFNFDASVADLAMKARGAIAVPFAALPQQLMDALDLTSPVVSLSVEGAAAIKTPAGKPLPYEDFAAVQQMLEGGEVVRRGLDLIFQQQLDGDWWRAVVSRASGKFNELYLTAFENLGKKGYRVPAENDELIRLLRK